MRLTLAEQQQIKQKLLTPSLSSLLFLSHSLTLNSLGIIKNEEKFQKDHKTMKNNVFHLRFFLHSLRGRHFFMHN